MAQDSYKHISIEEDEEVFVVGAAACAPQATGSEEMVPEGQAAQEAASVQSESSVQPVPTASMRPASAVSREEHDLTADDLRGEPMSLLQKIIIAAAIVGVIVLVAYLVL